MLLNLLKKVRIKVSSADWTTLLNLQVVQPNLSKGMSLP